MSEPPTSIPAASSRAQELDQPIKTGVFERDIALLGRSRGGANTKIHAVVEAGDRVMRLLLTPENRHDVAAAPELVEGLEKAPLSLKRSP